jgi:hypothetical protein
MNQIKLYGKPIRVNKVTLLSGFRIGERRADGLVVLLWLYRPRTTRSSSTSEPTCSSATWTSTSMRERSTTPSPLSVSSLRLQRESSLCSHLLSTDGRHSRPSLPFLSHFLDRSRPNLWRVERLRLRFVQRLRVRRRRDRADERPVPDEQGCYRSVRVQEGREGREARYAGGEAAGGSGDEEQRDSGRWSHAKWDDGRPTRRTATDAGNAASAGHDGWEPDAVRVSLYLSTP